MMVPIAVVAVGYLAVFRRLTHQSLTLAGSLAALGGITLPFIVMVFVATIMLRSEGLDVRTIARKALQQPRWWRGWYPRSLRRRGDVWERLPRQIRRVRVFWSLTLLSLVGLFLPLQVVLMRSRHSGMAGLLQYVFFLIPILVVWRVRRCSKYISSTFEMNINDARKLVFASTSRLSIWHRTPASMRLLGYTTTSLPTAGTESAVSRPMPVRSTNDESPTVG
jgi:hypothetical protein